MPTAFPETTYPYAVGNTLEIEAGFSDALVNEPQARGHAIEAIGTAGSANMIVIRSADDVEVGAEPRNPVASGTVATP